MIDLPQLMIRADVATALQLGERAVDKLRLSGQPPALRLGGRRVNSAKRMSRRCFGRTPAVALRSLVAPYPHDRPRGRADHKYLPHGVSTQAGPLATTNRAPARARD